MKKNRTILLLLGLALALALAPAVKTAFAYFTDYEPARGGAVIHLAGQTELHEEVVEGNKTVTIENTGETDMVVRVMVFGEASRMSIEAGSDWTFSEADNAYYYAKVLEPGETTESIEVTVKGKEGDNFDIVVVHEGSRVIYETVDGKEQVQKPDGWTGMPVIKGGE